MLVGPGDLEAVLEIALYVLLLEPLEVAPPDDPRGGRAGGEVAEVVQEVVLAGKYRGKKLCCVAQYASQPQK